METLFKEYAKMEKSFQALQNKREDLRNKILETLQEKSLEKVESKFGKFTVSHRASWRYTDKIEKIEERLKLARIREQEKGLATKVETPYLLFTKPTIN